MKILAGLTTALGSLMLVVTAAVLICAHDPTPAYILSFISNRDGQWDVYILYSENAVPERVTHTVDAEQDLDWHPGGRYLVATRNIALLSSTRTLQLVQIRVPDGRTTLLTATSGDFVAPRWEREGDAIRVSASFGDGYRSLYRLHTSDGKMVKWLDIGGSIYQWAAYKNRLLVVTDNSSNIDISQFKVPDMGAEPLVATPDIESQPDISPDGQSIAYVRFREGKSDIFHFDLVTHELTNLTQTDVYAMTPRWSPDGQWIAYATNVDGNFEIYRMRSDGSDKQNITSSIADELSPAWSPFYAKQPHHWLLLGAGILGTAAILLGGIHNRG